MQHQDCLQPNPLGASDLRTKPYLQEHVQPYYHHSVSLSPCDPHPTTHMDEESIIARRGLRSSSVQRHALHANWLMLRRRSLTSPRDTRMPSSPLCFCVRILAGNDRMSTSSSSFNTSSFSDDSSTPSMYYSSSSSSSYWNAGGETQCTRWDIEWRSMLEMRYEARTLPEHCVAG